MRIFCLNFHRAVNPSIAEAFLKFTPLLHFREPGLLFGDIRQTLILFKSSKHLLEEVMKRVQELGLEGATIALSDTAAGAQALSHHFPFFISEPGREAFCVSPLPVSSFKDLEGLAPWDELPKVERIAEFLATLGLKTIGDVQKLPAESWNLRWGELGTRLRKKVMASEQYVFAPLIPDTPLVAYHHFDFPIADREWLLTSMKPRLQELLFRLEGRAEALDELSLWMACEYSDHQHQLRISPSHKARDLDLLLNLLSERFQKLNLENPVREWEIEIKSLAHTAEQLDFWEPQSAMDKDNLLKLQSLFHDRQLKSGFLKIVPKLLPEDSSVLANDAGEVELPRTEFAFEERNHREFPVHSEGLNHAPRPTQLLPAPVPLTNSDLKAFRFLQPYPLERLYLPWLKTARDYWIALNAKHQCVWIFRDLATMDYFLHGYFD